MLLSDSRGLPSFLQNGLPINLNELERIYGSFIHIAGNVGKINSRNETWRYDAADLWRGKYRVCFNWKDFTSCLLIYREIQVIDRPRFSRRRFFSRGRFIIANLISKYLQSEISNERTIRKFANRIFDRFSKNRSTKNPFSNFHPIKRNIANGYVQHPIYKSSAPPILSSLPNELQAECRQMRSREIKAAPVYVGDTCF